MKSKRFLTLLTIILLAICAKAQNRQLTGTVKDAATGLPVSGASITIPGGSAGTATDSSGYFSIRVTANTKSIQVSVVNYQSRVVEIGQKDNLQIILQVNNKGLDEVIVVGYGTQKKKDLTGSISTVSAKDIGGRQTVQVSDALQGSISGVSVTRSSGAPGAGSTIRFRGITTTNNNNPLILVDGVPVDNIDNVNPNDIENISALKDASSAAIYGSRGAAGVILVTTKRAKDGQASLEYNYEYGVQKPTSLPGFVGVQDYMRYINEQSVNDGASSGPYTKAYIDSYLDSNRANPDKFPNTDWQKATLTNSVAPRTRHDLILSLGTSKLKTKISMGYQSIGAFYDNYDYKRYQVRLNNDLQINSRLSANLDIAFKRTVTNSPIPTQGFGNPIYEGRVMPPIYAAYYSNGQFPPGKDGRNPVAQIYQGGNDKASFNQVLGRFLISFKPIKDITLTGLVSPTFDFNQEKVFSRLFNYSDPTNPTRVVTNLRGSTDLNEYRIENLVMNGQLLANYKKTIKEKHNIEVLAGYEENYNKNENINAARNGFSLSTFPYLNAGSRLIIDNAGSAYETGLRSIFGRLNYNYNDKYYVQGNVRRDESSRFAPAFRSAVFPSVSAGWVISQEKFLQKTNWLSFLKLRASWGKAGNERIGNYPYQSIENASTALFYQGTTVVPLTGYAQTDFAINNISWETTSTQDIGADMAFLQNKLTVTADYFYRKTTGILLIQDIPNYIGYNDPTNNIGSLSAKGWELEVAYKNNIGKLRYSISVNASDSKTKIINISNPGVLGNQVNLPGYEYNAWYGYKSNGLFQSADDVAKYAGFPNSKPGDVRYVDLNGNGKISSDSDRTILGGSLPRYLYGGNIHLDYSNFDFTLAFQGVGKRNIMQPAEAIQPFAEAFGNMPSALAGKFWSTNNTAAQNLAAKYPRLSRTTSGNNYTTSDFYMISGAYFRMKNISVGYTLTAPWLKKAGVQSLRFYGAVNDLFTISKVPGYLSADPESASYGYPIVRTFLFGASVKF